MKLHVRRLILALALGSLPHAEPQAMRDVDEFARLVAESVGLTGERELERRARQLARAPGAVEKCLELLAREARHNDPEGGLRLDDGQRRLLARTTELLEPALVAEQVREDFSAIRDDAWRSSALALLARHGSGSELPLLVELVLDAEPPKPRAGLRDAFTDALAELLAREGVSASRLDALVDRTPALKEPIVRAVGRARDPEGLTWLASLLPDHEVGQLALLELGRLAASTSGEAAAVAAEQVHPLLQYENDSWRRGALRALGSLAQPASVPWLLRSLERERSPSERRLTFGALRKIARIQLPDDLPSWERWYAREEAWLQDASERVAPSLASADDAQVVAALHELSTHPLYRERLGATLAGLLEHPSSTVRAQTCLALARLGSTRASADLAPALEDDDEAVRMAACRALDTLTGWKLGTDALAWLEALEEHAQRRDLRRP